MYEIQIQTYPDTDTDYMYSTINVYRVEINKFSGHQKVNEKKKRAIFSGNALRVVGKLSPKHEIVELAVYRPLANNGY